MAKNPDTILNKIVTLEAEVGHYLWNPQVVNEEKFVGTTEYTIEFNSADKSPFQIILVKCHKGWFWDAEPDMEV